MDRFTALVLDVGRGRGVRAPPHQLELPPPELLRPGVDDDAAETELEAELEGEVAPPPGNVEQHAGSQIFWGNLAVV